MLRAIVSKIFGEKSRKPKKRKLDDIDDDVVDDENDKIDDGENLGGGDGGDSSDPDVESTDDLSKPSKSILVTKSAKNDVVLRDVDDESPEDAPYDTSSIQLSTQPGPSGVNKIAATSSSGPISSASFDQLQAGCSGSCGGGGRGLAGCSGSSGSGIGENLIPSMASSFPALPPPKRKKASRVIEEAEDWCETDANWKDIQYTWTINSFSKCQEELGNYVTSPEFPSTLMAAGNHNHSTIPPAEEDLAFYLKVHLKGENEDSDHLAVYIVCKGPEEVLASFELSIIVDGKKCNLRDSKKVCQFAEEHHPAWGFKKFIQFDELQNVEKGYLKDDRLKLHCEVKFVVVKNLRPIHVNWGDATFKAENRVEEGMERLDVDQLWRDRRLYSDVTIICQDQEIPANRVLLATRSEVFRAMFSHPTKESTSGRIEITDVDPAVFEQMLAYIYTGFSPHVDSIAEELLIAANKYALEELKTDCVRVLESNLSVDNVLEMLVIGDHHEAAKLKEAAFAFLVKRLDVFMDKNFKILWQKFKEAHPALTTETVKVLLEKQPVTKYP